tara:strand:+ start:1138 stop:1833 length:696 start_codon:yes stop_codon:yes gene_type:complete
MNSLYVFGCSYTAPYSKSTTLNSTLYDKYFHYRNQSFPKTWPEILSLKLNLKLNNLGKEAEGNDYVFESFCKISDKIKKGDYVVYEVPYIERFRLIDDGDEWVSANSQTDDVYCPLNISEFIGLQRTSDRYKEEVLNQLNFIKAYSESKGFKLYIWFADNPFHRLVNLNDSTYLLNKILSEDNNNTVFNPVFDLGGLRIFEETNNEIDDMHFGESAHEILAELFYNHIIKN